MFVKKNAGIVAAAALAVASLGAPAHAEKGVVEVGGFLGWHLFSDNSNQGKPVFEKRHQQVLDDALAFGLRAGYFILDRLSIEGELALIPTDARGNDADNTFAFAYRAQVLYMLSNFEQLGGSLHLVVGGGGLTNTKGSRDGKADVTGGPVYQGIDASTGGYFHVGFAAKVALGDTWGLRFDGRLFLVDTAKRKAILDANGNPVVDAMGNVQSEKDGILTDDWEVTVGVYKHFGGKKKEEPAPEPEPAKDSDGDGIADDTDKCPNEAEDKDGFQDEDGCPDPDNDGDGVPDSDDKCPNEAENKNGIDDEDGCPDEDADGDGILGSKDNCPNEAEDKDGFQDEDGCPDPDNDGDGVPDAQDQCPDQLETKNGYKDNDGCADELPKAVAKYTGSIKGINFKTGSAEITAGSFKVLNDAAKVLKEYPELMIEVQGHTDDVGDDQKNLELSQARAQSVKAYLVAQGVEDGRIRAIGYGETKPIEAKKTAAARAKNRRVEFQLITGDAPAAPAPAAPAPAAAPEAAPAPAK